MWFPAKMFLQPIPITTLCQYPLGILGPSIHCQNHISTWIWCLDIMEGMLLLVYHPDLLQFNPPSPSATIVLLRKSWDMTHTSIGPHCYSVLLLYQIYFLKISNGKEI